MLPNYSREGSGGNSGTASQKGAFQNWKGGAVPALRKLAPARCEVGKAIGGGGAAGAVSCEAVAIQAAHRSRGVITAPINNGSTHTCANERSALDARTALCLHIEGHWPGASESGRSAAGHAMRHSIIISLLTLALVGCAESRHDEALKTWRSQGATLEQRARAAARLVPKGANQQTARSILGTNGAWTHSWGPNVEISWSQTDKPPRRLPDYDVWSLEYEFPGGGVALYFDPPTAMGDRFVSASAFTSSK